MKKGECGRAGRGGPRGTPRPSLLLFAGYRKMEAKKENLVVLGPPFLFCPSSVKGEEGILLKKLKKKWGELGEEI